MKRWWRVTLAAAPACLALVAGCGSRASDQTETDELEALDDFEGADENDAPPFGEYSEPPTLTDEEQVPWIGPVSPGVAGETNSVTVSQVVPGNPVFLLLAPTGGSFQTPDCGIDLDLDDPELLGTLASDSSGVASFDFMVDLEDADVPMVLQAVDLESCVVSAPSPVTFKDPGPGPGTTGSTGTGSTGTGSTGSTGTGSTGTPPAGDPTVCYPGDRMAYDVCVTLEPAGTQGSDYVYPTSSSWNYAEPTHFLELVDIPASVMVAPNFRRDELAQEWKGDWAVVQVHAVERLQDLRDDVGALVVNSGYRSPDYNASVGGATLSRHMYGDAFDLDPVSVTLTELESSCYNHGAGFVSVYTSHVHCDWRDDSQEDAFYGEPPPPPMPTGHAAAAPLGAWPVPSAHIELVNGIATAPADGLDCGEPLREWVAYDADGDVVAQATGATFEPPPEAVEVEVDVGRVVHRRLSLP